MGDHRKLAHLEEQLGKEHWDVLLDPRNTGEFQAVCSELLARDLPAEITVGEITYELLPVIKDNEKYVKGDVMISRAKEMGAECGKEDYLHIHTHENDIHAKLRGKVILIFADWQNADNPESIAYARWCGVCWFKYWGWQGQNWGHNCRVLRRKPGQNL